MANISQSEVEKFNRDANVDPISGELGAHPVGAGLGAFSGAIAGAAIASVFGPIGTIAGATAGGIFGVIFGGIAGAYTGRDIAELVNPTEIDTYWSTNYTSRPYVTQGEDYKIYEPAYRYGYDLRTKHNNRNFDDFEDYDLSEGWHNIKNSPASTSTLEWDKARDAVRDSYDYTDRLYRDKLKIRNA